MGRFGKGTWVFSDRSVMLVALKPVTCYRDVVKNERPLKQLEANELG